MASQHYLDTDRRGYSHSPATLSSSYCGLYEQSSPFSTPQHRTMSYRVEPPLYKSRQSDYIARPAYSNTDYIAPYDRHPKHGRSSRSRSSKDSRLDYISRPVESTHDHISNQYGSATSASTYVDRPDDSQLNSCAFSSSSGFCQPIPSARPAAPDRQASVPSFSAPCEEQSHRRISDATQRRKHRVAFASRRANENIHSNQQVNMYNHRSGLQSKKRYETADGYGSDYQACSINPVPNTQDEDGYGSDYQAFPEDRRRDSYDVNDSDGASDIVPFPNVTPPPRKPRRGFTSENDDNTTYSSNKYRGYPLLSGDEGTSSSSTTFCSPPPSRIRSQAYSDEEYGSDVEIGAPCDSPSIPRESRKRRKMSEQYGSDVEITLDGGVALDSDWSSEGSDYVEDDRFMSDDDNIYGDYCEVRKEHYPDDDDSYD